MTATRPTPRLYHWDDLLDEAVADAEMRHNAATAKRPLGPVSGLKRLDDRLAGAFLPGLHVLHGSPGSGKTALAWQIAATCGCPCLYVTCEMAPIELLRRMAARVTGEYLGRFKSGEFSPQSARELFRRAVESAPLLAIVDATQAPATLSDLLEFAETVKATAPDNPHLLIVIDSVHSWSRGWQADATEYDALNAGVGGLVKLASKTKAAVLGIGERSKGTESKGGMSATAGTRVFEYAAETVLGLDPEGDAGGSGAGAWPRSVTLRLEKNRNGAAGRPVYLLFDGRIQLFTEAAQ
jgi:replicative DNA helicase